MAKPAITKSQKRLFIILALLAMYAVYDVATSKRKPAPTKSAPLAEETAVTNTATPAATVSVPWPREWKRDPFQKNFVSRTQINLDQVVAALSSSPHTGQYHLTAISRNGKKSYALINEQILGLGDAIDGFKVIEIGATGVVLKKNDFHFTLSLPEEEYN